MGFVIRSRRNAGDGGNHGFKEISVKKYVVRHMITDGTSRALDWNSVLLCEPQAVQGYFQRAVYQQTSINWNLNRSSVLTLHNVADIGAVLDVLAWPKAHLVGMSYGGLIAAHFAAAAPCRISSLVTIDVGPGVVFEGTARIREFFQRVDPRDGLEAMVEAVMQTSPSSDRERVAYRMAALMRRDLSGDWRWARDDRRSPDYPALLTKVEEMVIAAERLAAPCLVVRGGRSEVFRDEAAWRFAARFANGQWIAVPDAGHNVQEDNPAGLIAALSRFWSPRND